MGVRLSSVRFEYVNAFVPAQFMHACFRKMGELHYGARARHNAKLQLAAWRYGFVHVAKSCQKNFSMHIGLFLKRCLHRFSCVKNHFLKVSRSPIKYVLRVSHISFYCVSHKRQHSFHFGIEFCHKF